MSGGAPVNPIGSIQVGVARPSAQKRFYIKCLTEGDAV
jgi:hypothetical protein